MKKIFATILLLLTVVITLPAQAQSNVELNNTSDKFVNLTTGRGVPAGVVVNISTYLSVRTQPSIYAREIVRISNGTRVGIADGSAPNGFYKIYCWVGSNFISGYAHSDYISYTGGYFDLP